MNSEIYEKIIQKKEFSQLPREDVERAWKHFEKRQTSEEEKIKLTRDLLRKVFSVFTSLKLLNLKRKESEWILKKHISTRERLPFYKEVYSRIFKDCKNDLTIFDLGAGINGLSYDYFPKKVNYVGIEAMGQLVTLMNSIFKDRGKENFGAIHLSLFELEKLKKIINSVKGEKIIFLFKTLDSLEMLERDYSKKVLLELVPLVNKIVVSFATRSLVARKRFYVKRNWIVNFIQENFNVLGDFENGGERYLIIESKDK